MSRRSPITWPVPTPWFAGLLALTGFGLFAWPGHSWSTFWVIDAVLLAVFVADAALCVSPRSIGVIREVAESVRVGEDTPLAWVIENRGSRSCRATVTDALWPSLGAGRRSASVSIGSHERLRVRTELTPARRGRFPFDDVTVRVMGPLRMALRQATSVVPGAIRVMPAYPSRDAVRRRTHLPRVPDVGLRSLRRVGAGTEFDQLRDYRHGDEFRRIDWSSTMRLQRPIVKQHRVERNQTVVIMLDNGRMMAGTVGEVARVEHAMDAALGLADAAIRMSDRVGVVCFDRQVRSLVAASSSRSHLGRVSEAMFLLEPDLAESAYTAAFSYAASRFRRRSLYVVLTDLAEATVEQALLPALSILIRTHLVVVAAVRDPVVSAWAHDSGVEWPSDVFRSAAAIASLHQRERAAARLRSVGAIVIDAEPGRLAVDVVDTYLDLKASGRL
jgi:uncharacterized protein (DUF58 family)